MRLAETEQQGACQCDSGMTVLGALSMPPAGKMQRLCL